MSSIEIPSDWLAPSESDSAAPAASSSSPTSSARPASSPLLLEFDPLEEASRPPTVPSPAPSLAKAELSSVQATGEHVQAKTDAEEGLQEQEDQPQHDPSPPPPPVPPKAEPSSAHLQQASRSSSVSSLASVTGTGTPSKPQHSSLITAIAGTFKRRQVDSAAASSSSSAPAPPPPKADLNEKNSTGIPSPRPERQSSTSSSLKNGQQVQFDFPRFLEQLKSRPAEPVAKYLKSFLTNFAKRTFTMNESIKLVHDFLDFIALRMGEVEPWKSMAEAELDMALEGMEKLVMNRVYPFTFTPQIDRSKHPITTDDLERDNVFAQRARLFGWIEGKHLDVDDGAEAEEKGDKDEGLAIKGYLKFAGQELLKVNHYKAPRDKLICILNCCKVIFGLMRHMSEGSATQGADNFIPLLIYVVLKSNPPHLISNIEYINRFRSASKLQAEAGYYLSSLTGTTTFIEGLDFTSLSNISKEEFEANVESAVAHLPPLSPIEPSSIPSKPNPHSSAAVSAASAPFSTTLEGEEPASQITSGSSTFALDTKRFFADNVSKIGKIFADVVDGTDAERVAMAEDRRRESAAESGTSNESPPYQPRIRSPRPRNLNVGSSHPPSGPSHPMPPPPGPSLWDTISSDLLSVLPSARSTPPAPSQPHAPSQDYYAQQQAAYPSGRQPPLVPQPNPNPFEPYSNEYPDDENIDFKRLQLELDARDAQARETNLSTLSQMFPGMDPELIAMVLDAKQGDLAQATESLLDMGV